MRHLRSMLLTAYQRADPILSWTWWHSPCTDRQSCSLPDGGDPVSYGRRVKGYCHQRGLRWGDSLACAGSVCGEQEYYEDLIRFYRSSLRVRWGQMGHRWTLAGQCSTR